MRLGSYKVDPDKCEGIRQNGRIKQKYLSTITAWKLARKSARQ